MIVRTFGGPARPVDDRAVGKSGLIRKLLWVVVGFAILGGATLGAAAMFMSRQQVPTRPPPPPSLLVEVAEAQREAVTFSIFSQGSVSPRTQTTLQSEVSGQIIDVSDSFVSGGFFDAGDVLVRIDPRLYETNLKRAAAAVARAETQVATETALAGYALEDWQRLRNLDETTSEASQLTLRKPQLAEALATLESAEADLTQATEDLDRTIIRAPYAGMVRNKRADLGQYVNTGTPLAEIFGTDYAEVRLPLTQADLRYIDLPTPGQSANLPVSLTASLGGDLHTWWGTIVRSEGVFDETRRVLHVVAEIVDPYDTSASGRTPARVGTFVSAEIRGREGGALFVVPRSALHRGDTVWVVDEDLRIQPRPVNVVRTSERSAFIDGGIQDGDRYCLNPPDQPLPGMKVRLSG